MFKKTIHGLPYVSFYWKRVGTRIIVGLASVALTYGLYLIVKA